MGWGERNNKNSEWYRRHNSKYEKPEVNPVFKPKKLTLWQKIKNFIKRRKIRYENKT